MDNIAQFSKEIGLISENLKEAEKKLETAEGEKAISLQKDIDDLKKLRTVLVADRSCLINLANAPPITPSKISYSPTEPPSYEPHSLCTCFMSLFFRYTFFKFWRLLLCVANAGDDLFVV